jgi:CIC family chloride channel protein
MSPDLKKLADEGKIFTREYDKNLFLLINTNELIEPVTSTLNINSTYADLLEVIKTGNRNVIPVLDHAQLAGIVYLDDLRPILFNPEFHDQIEVLKVMKIPVEVIHADDDMLSVVNKFDETSTWVLPVVDNSNNFVGFISKSAVLNRYRQVLKEHSDLA